jgi:hypothetical protein
MEQNQLIWYCLAWLTISIETGKPMIQYGGTSYTPHDALQAATELRARTGNEILVVATPNGWSGKPVVTDYITNPVECSECGRFYGLGGMCSRGHFAPESPACI